MTATTLRHLAEAALLRFLYAALRMLPLDVASAVGALLGRAAGPFTKAHRIAKGNLALAYPHATNRERRAIVMRMWEQLGRVAAELPHLPGNALTSRIRVHGLEHLPKEGEQVLFFSGHLGNWELLSAMAYDHGVPLTLIYRHANNPYVDALIARMRRSHCVALVPKGPRGAAKIARALKSGGSMAMLVDQKMNDGVAVPFFGRSAMTAPAIATLSLKYNLPIVPALVVRTGGAHFDGFVFPRIQTPNTGDIERDTLAILSHINQLLESWIRAHPEQWFWVHRRWPSADS